MVETFWRAGKRLRERTEHRLHGPTAHRLVKWGPARSVSGEWYSEMGNSERHDEDVWQHSYCPVLPKISRGDPLSTIKVILQLHIIEDGECSNFSWAREREIFENVPLKLFNLVASMVLIMTGRSGPGGCSGSSHRLDMMWRSGDRWEYVGVHRWRA